MDRWIMTDGLGGAIEWNEGYGRVLCEVSHVGVRIAPMGLNIRRRVPSSPKRYRHCVNDLF